MKTKRNHTDPRDVTTESPRVEHRRRGIGAVATAILLAILWVVGGAPRVAGADPYAPAIFPLHVGDAWNYEAPGNRRAEVRITGCFQYRDRLVYRVQGYLFAFSSTDVLFFEDENGMTAELDPARGPIDGELGRPHPVVPLITGVWYPWSDLGRRVEIPRFAPDCIHGTGGTMKSGVEVAVPAGDFTNAISIRYDTHPCADQDLVSETFVPGVGLVARSVSTFIGEERWALTSAIVDGQLIGVPNEMSWHGRRAAEAAPHAPDTWGRVKAAFAR